MAKVQAKRVADYDSCDLPGEFFLTAPNESEGGARRLYFRCPCGCGDLCGIRIRDDGYAAVGIWGWDKNEDTPTVSPSIMIVQNHWHGFLRNGVFESC